MAIFTSLVKALLLHATDTAHLLAEVKSDRAAKVLSKIRDDPEYHVWLADRFFVFYLNRTRAAAQQTPGQSKQTHPKARHAKKASVDSRYMS